MTSFAFGHALRIKPQQTELYRFQNFFIGKQITHNGSGYQFVPFGFSGVTVNRTGDGLEATIVFPNSDPDGSGKYCGSHVCWPSNWRPMGQRVSES